MIIIIVIIIVLIIVVIVIIITGLTYFDWEKKLLPPTNDSLGKHILRANYWSIGRDSNATSAHIGSFKFLSYYACCLD